MHIILSTFGTAGDTLPLIELGRCLLQAGHDVDFCGLGYFGERVRAAGLPFHPIGPPGLFEDFANDAMTWHSYKGFPSLWKRILQAVPDTLAAVARLHRPGRTILVGTSGALGVRLAQEQLGLRCVTIHMAPFYLFSRIDNCFGGLGCWPARWPLWFRRLAFATINRLYIDGVARKEFNALRASIGLKPIKNVFTRWVNSPDRIICAVPPWFAAPQPDWPSHVVSTPFPITISVEKWRPEADLRAFLANGPPPILFCAATGVGAATVFFRRAIEVGRLMQRRVLLVSRFSGHIPDPLPDYAFHIDYAPFDHLLPHVEAIVHQGGIGTIALSMRAGIPQVIVPFAYDQFYNGVCIERLGVGRKVPRSMPSDLLADVIMGFLTSAPVRERCEHYRGVVNTADSGVAAMMKYIEALDILPTGEDWHRGDGS